MSAGSTTVHEMKCATTFLFMMTLSLGYTCAEHVASRHEDPIIEIGTGGGALAGIKIVKDTVATNNQSGFFREKASDDGTTPACFGVYEEFNDPTPITSSRRSATCAGYALHELVSFLGGPLSVGGQLYVEGAVSSRAACHCRVSRTWRVISRWQKQQP